MVQIISGRVLAAIRPLLCGLSLSPTLMALSPNHMIVEHLPQSLLSPQPPLQPSPQPSSRPLLQLFKSRPSNSQQINYRQQVNSRQQVNKRQQISNRQQINSRRPPHRRHHFSQCRRRLMPSMFGDLHHNPSCLLASQTALFEHWMMQTISEQALATYRRLSRSLSTSPTRSASHSTRNHKTMKRSSRLTLRQPTSRRQPRRHLPHCRRRFSRLCRLRHSSQILLTLTTLFHNRETAMRSPPSPRPLRPSSPRLPHRRHRHRRLNRCRRYSIMTTSTNGHGHSGWPLRRLDSLMMCIRRFKSHCL